MVISTTLSSLLLCRLRLFRRIPVSYCCVLRYLTSNWNKRLENRIRLIPLKQILRRLMWKEKSVTCGSHANNVCVFKDLVVLLSSNFFQLVHFLIKHHLEIRDSLVTTLTRIAHPSAVQTPAVFLRKAPHILDLESDIKQQFSQRSIPDKNSHASSTLWLWNRLLA